MRYEPIGKDLFITNRKRFAEQLLPSSVAVFHSNDIMPTNADGTMGFRQSADLFYLTGIDQEESILLICPNANDPKMREVLFLRETNDYIARWEGHKYTKEEARETSGIGSIFWTSEFDTIFNNLMAESEHCYLNTNEHLRNSNRVQTADARFIKQCQEKYPLHSYKRSAPIMHYLRAIKQPREIELIKHACGITEKAFRRILPFIKPGVWEHEIEAEIWHEFIRNRSRGPAYTMILGSGASANVLHYIENDKQCQDGDVILMDFGAEYANYASDLSRSVPVNGKFTKRQREVYEAVLRVMKGATQRLVVGNIWDEYHTEVGHMMENELIGLGLLNEQDVRNQDPAKPLYKKYFMHGTSHFLGLDVHDVGNKYRRFEEGMVFTCEPGIYIEEENLGIRLENDILVTKNGPVDLMASIPLEADDIERLMAQR